MNPTKLLVTLRPGTDVMTRARGALERGIRAFRVNFARCAVDDNVALLHALQDVAALAGTAAEFFIDLPGPKPRTAPFARGGEFLLQGDAFELFADPQRRGDALGVGVSDPLFLQPLRRGAIVKLADGHVHLRVTGKTQESVSCRVVKPGKVYSRCGMVSPLYYGPNESLTAKDRLVLATLDVDVTAVCVSFADSPAVVAEARAAARGRPLLFAKLESPAAVARMRDLALVSDGVIHARGDLRAFFTPREMRSIAADLRASTVAVGRLLILATNYFTGVCSRGALSPSETREIEYALSLQPDYLLVNETSHAACWREIMDTGVSCLSRRPTPRVPEANAVRYR